MSISVRRHAPQYCAARRSTNISACSVASCCISTSLCARAIMFPWRTAIAPTGTSPRSKPRCASASASCMNCRVSFSFGICELAIDSSICFSGQNNNRVLSSDLPRLPEPCTYQFFHTVSQTFTNTHCMLVCGYCGTVRMISARGE